MEKFSWWCMGYHRARQSNLHNWMAQLSQHSICQETSPQQVSKDFRCIGKYWASKIWTEWWSRNTSARRMDYSIRVLQIMAGKQYWAAKCELWLDNRLDEIYCSTNWWNALLDCDIKRKFSTATDPTRFDWCYPFSEMPKLAYDIITKHPKSSSKKKLFYLL